MASKYLQQYPIPDQFPEILHDFTREVLRAQPDDIIEFAAQYFEHKAKGTEFKFQSKFNIAKKPNPKQYNKVPHQELTEQARNVVNQSNQQPLREEKNDTSSLNPTDRQNQNDISHHSQNISGATHPEEKAATKEYVGEVYQHAIEHILEDTSQNKTGNQGSNHNQSQQDQTGQSSDKPADITHPQEKQMAKEYSEQLLKNVIQQANEQIEQDDQAENLDGGEEQADSQKEQEEEQDGSQHEQQEEEQGGEQFSPENGENMEDQEEEQGDDDNQGQFQQSQENQDAEQEQN